MVGEEKQEGPGSYWRVWAWRLSRWIGEFACPPRSYLGWLKRGYVAFFCLLVAFLLVGETGLVVGMKILLGVGVVLAVWSWLAWFRRGGS